jgi:hypothetical protein
MEAGQNGAVSEQLLYTRFQKARAELLKARMVKAANGQREASLGSDAAEDDDVLLDSGSVQFSTMVQRGQFVITNIFAGLILRIISTYGAAFELNMTVLLLFLLWVMIASQLSGVLKRLSTAMSGNTLNESNKRWLSVILRVIQFVTYIALFTVFQLFSNILEGLFTGAPWPSEAIIGLLVFIVALYTFVAWAEQFQVYKLLS